MAKPRITRDEYFRQLRAETPALLEKIIGLAIAGGFPETVEVGQCTHFDLHFHCHETAPEIALAIELEIIACEGESCTSRIEVTAPIGSHATGEILRARGWQMRDVAGGARLLCCPRCAGTPTRG